MYNVQLEWITPSPRGLGDDRGAEIEQLGSGSPRSSRGRTRPAKLFIMAQGISGQHVISTASEERNHIKIVLLQSCGNDLCLLLSFTFFFFRLF